MKTELEQALKEGLRFLAIIARDCMAIARRETGDCLNMGETGAAMRGSVRRFERMFQKTDVKEVQMI